MTSLRVSAPAKINWTLEVLGKRDDGYHKVRTVLQTIALSDMLTLMPADSLALTLSGDAGALAGQPTERNLAYRAAARLRRERPYGARIGLEKRIPIAAGFGGGSSDAAAVLRGLRTLWQLDVSDDELTSIATELGSDVPFFLHGGTALASGRGERIDLLQDAPEQRLLLAWPDLPSRNDKTSRMYAALRSNDFTDGSASARLAEHLEAGKAVAANAFRNVFERALARIDRAYAQRLEELPSAGGPHLCGSGPAIFYLLDPDQPAEPLQRVLEKAGLRVTETQTLSAVEATVIEELP